MNNSILITPHKILLTVAALWISFIHPLSAQDYAAQRVTVAALGTDANMLTAPTIFTDDSTPGTAATLAAGDEKVIYFDALDYQGNPTRVYAWVGIPAGATAGSPVPGMVLVHGGGGSASQTWIQKWTARGYAAISISVEGQRATSADKHAMAGPSRTGTYNDTGVDPITDQWMYHAVADCILANSLLRSLPEVDATKVGLSGFSWGGVITSTVIGVDNRFKFAIPTYGCGHLYDSRNHYGAQLGNNGFYKEVWDPMIRIANATMPVLWFSWPEEPHFQMDSLAYTYHGAPGVRMVSLKPGMGHGGNWHSPEYYDFADSIIATGSPWCVQQSLNVSGNTATVVFSSTKSLHSASLVYTTGNDLITTGIDTNLVWTETALSAPVESPAGTWTATATLPAGVTGWFVNVKATGSDTGDLYGYTTADITASSDYQEIIDLSPSSVPAIEHQLANDQTNSTVEVAYTGPANVEVSSITISGESHAGSFSSLTAAPLVMLTPTPDTTPLTIQFDNTVAGLTDGQTATATLTIVWDELDGSTDQIALPLSATATDAITVVHDTSADWASKDVNDIDEVIIQNDATVTVGEFVEPNLVVNGSFEAPGSPDVADNGIDTYGVGNVSLSNWTISGSGVWLIDTWDRFGNEANTVAADGDQYLQLQDSGTGAATISQDITTEVGATYRLTFGYSGVDTTTHSVVLAYSAGGSNQSVTYNTGTPMLAWQTETFEFQATGTTTSISFTGQSVGGGFYGIGIDDVTITKIVEPNLITNGSFEAPVIGAQFSAQAAASGGLSSWTITDTGVVMIDSFDNFGAWTQPAESSDGIQFLQLQTHSGTGPGTISQTFATTAGTTYQLEFDYSGIYPGDITTSLTYDVGSGAQTVNMNITGNQLPWATETHQFVATGSTATLSFTGNYVAGFWGASIDNVSVKALPATSDTADTLVVNDDASPITATLDINQDYALTATTSIVLGAGTGAGFVNQSNGTVTTASLTVNSSGTGDTSQYNLSGGSLEATATVVNNAGELNFTGGSMKSNGAITVNSGGTFTVNRSDTVTQGTDFGGGGISGAGAVVKNGSGTLVLNAANTYTGGTTVNGGTLDLVGQNRIDGALTVDGTGMVKLSGTGHNALQNMDMITLQNGGTYTDNSQGSFVQSVYAPVAFINGGTMTSEPGSNGLGNFGNYLFIYDINVSGTGLATISSSGISFNYGKTITVADTVAGVGTDLLITSTIKNERAGTIIKAGVGKLTLTGVNTDTSPWSITSGTLEISGAGQLQSGSYAGTVANNGTFEYNSTANQTMSGAISGFGALVKNGTGTLDLPEHNTYSGATTINQGILKLSGNQKRNLNTTYTVDGAGAVLEAANIQVFSSFGSSYDKLLTATNGGTIKATSVAIRLGDVTLDNSSSLTANAANGAYGGFYIGQLAAGASPTVTVSGSGASQIDGSGDFAIVATIFDVTDSTGNTDADLTVSAALHDMTSLNFTGNVLIPGAVTKAGSGTMTLSVANNYSGATTVNAGILSLGDGTNNTTLDDASDVIIASGAVLNLNYTGTDTIDELFLGGARAAAGSWGATGSGATHFNDTFFTGSGTLTVTFGNFDAWANEPFANAFVDTLPSSNPDSDGLSNLLEFAFGTDPTVSNGSSIGYGSGVTPGLPVAVPQSITSTTVDFRAVFARRKEWAAAGLTYTVQFSPDLTEWVDSAETPTLLESGNGDIDAVYVPYPLAIPTSNGYEKAQFFRLSISQD